MTRVDLANTRLVNGGVPGSEIGREPTKFLLYLYKQKSSRSSEQNSNKNHKNGVVAPQLIPRFESVYRPSIPRMKRRPGTLRKDPSTLLKIFTANLSSCLPQRGLQHFTRVTVY